MTDYAEAIIALEDAFSRLVYRAEEGGLSKDDIVKELQRQLADYVASHD